MHKFNLIENAKDSLAHAIDHIGPVETNSTGDWKRIILDLAHVVELLVKEKLRQIHPAFVFSNVDKYLSKNAHTIGAELAFERLQKVGGISFSDSDKKAITSIRGKRNEIEHYEFSIENKEAKVIVGQVLSFIIKFAENELNLKWKSLCTSNDIKWATLNDYKEFYDQLVERVMEELEDSYKDLIDCPLCGHETFDLDECLCHLCDHSEDVIKCPVCNVDFIMSYAMDDDIGGLCSDCSWNEGYAAAHHEKY